MFTLSRFCVVIVVCVRRGATSRLTGSWGVAHPLPRRRGNVTVGNHTFVNALPWMRRAGAPWRDPPERHGKWITVCRRFDRRSGNGAMGRLFTALREARIIGVEIRTPAHGPRVRGFHPAAGRVVRPDAGRTAQRETVRPHGIATGRRTRGGTWSNASSTA